MDFEIPQCEFVFEIRVECGAPQAIGPTPDGLAMMIPILGGTVSGPELRGRVLPGGADWPIRRAGNFNIIDAQYAIEADDGTVIRIHNRGVAFDENGHAAQNTGRSMPSYIRTVPTFVAPEGAHAWLNRTIFVGTLEAERSKGTFVIVRIFKVN
jgi:hypothetical protein